VDGGALAVENALKTAFDWKRRHNAAHGRDPEKGTKVLHLRRAFHGRSGYTLSLTNTDPVKTALFPVFDWPRIDVPAIHLHDDVAAAEQESLAQARAAFAAHPHDIACFIAEPIQGEGGDNHLRPEFLRAMQALCREHDALFVLDEVQTGGGMTGTPWAYQQLDVAARRRRVRQEAAGLRDHGRRARGRGARQRLRRAEPDQLHVGRQPHRHGALARNLEVVERDGLVERAGVLGKRLLDDLRAVPGISAVRGRGLFVAFDLPEPRGARGRCWPGCTPSTCWCWAGVSVRSGCAPR
jgi:L-lysine 6-transaminase